MTDDKRNPYMKFYARDWRGDGALRMCSFAARGLWVDLLTLMHDEGQPYGCLTVNGVSPSAAQLGRMLGSAPKDIEKLTAELERAGIFSRDQAGVIFSRRMVRDKAKAEFDKANGKRGGNPTLNGGDNPPLKAHSHSHSHSQNQNPVVHSSSAASDQSEFLEIQRLLAFDGNDHKNWLEFIAMKTRNGLDFAKHILPAAKAIAASGKTGKSLAYIRPKAIELRDQAPVSASAPVVFEDCDDMQWRGRLQFYHDHPELGEQRWAVKWGPVFTDPATRVPPAVLTTFKPRSKANGKSHDTE